MRRCADRTGLLRRNNVAGRLLPQHGGQHSGAQHGGCGEHGDTHPGHQLRFSLADSGEHARSYRAVGHAGAE